MDGKFFLLCLIAAGLAFKLIQSWLAHRRVDRNLEILKSYADQGKDPPPEIIKILQPDSVSGTNHLLRISSGLWVPVFLFAALTAGFIFMALSPSITEHDPSAQSGMIFVSILMGGLALGFLVTALGRRRAENQDRSPQR